MVENTVLGYITFPCLTYDLKQGTGIILITAKHDYRPMMVVDEPPESIAAIWGLVHRDYIPTTLGLIIHDKLYVDSSTLSERTRIYALLRWGFGAKSPK